MFGHTHPTLLKLEQVALEMRLMMLDPMAYFGVKKCNDFLEKHGVAFNENAFASTVSFFRQSHYLAIDLESPHKTAKVAYVGVHSVTGELVVFLSRRNPYPEYLPDHTKDIMVIYSQNVSTLSDNEWAAQNALGFFLQED